jgi:hypothetical protein
MKNSFLTLGVLLFAGVASQPALADTFFLTGSNTAVVPCSVSVPCGEVSVTTSGNTATFTVSSLDSGFVFDTFGFNFTGAGTLSLSSATGEVNSPSLGGSGNEDGFGTFTYNFNTGETGGSNGPDCVVTGGVPGAGCTFTFTVMDSLPGALTTSEFEALSSGGSGSGDFAGHLAAPAGNTGFVGDAVGSTSPVPEPSSLMLLGTGALTLAGLVRRRYMRRA